MRAASEWHRLDVASSGCGADTMPNAFARGVDFDIMLMVGRAGRTRDVTQRAQVGRGRLSPSRATAEPSE